MSDTTAQDRLPSPATAKEEKKPWAVQKSAQMTGMKVSTADAVKNEVIAAIGEFVGTTQFLFLAFGGTTVANIQSTGSTSLNDTVNPAQLQYIALSFGFSLLVSVWVFFRVSGGLFNPAVSLALAIAGAIKPLRAVVLIFSQIIGGIVAAALISGLLPGQMQVRTSLGFGTSIAQGLFLEMFLTFVLVITILMLAAEKHRSTYLAPVAIGLALFVCELVGVHFTGGSLNPARSFGPDVVLGKFDGYHWIYWLGPAMGACMAAGFHQFLKFFNYEEAAPDQDAPVETARNS